MDQYLTRARAAAAEFRAALASFAAAVANTQAAPPNIPAKSLERLSADAVRLGRAMDALDNSFSTIERTGVDLSDLQSRISQESSALAMGLKSIAEVVNVQAFVRRAFAEPLYALEEAAERLAARVFPAAVEGLDDVNRTVLELLRGQVKATFDRIMADQVRKGDLNAADLSRVQDNARAVWARVESVNSLLNQLVSDASFSEAEVEGAITAAKRDLSAAVQAAKKQAADKYKPFHGVLGQVEKAAAKISEQLSKLRVPVYPTFAALEELGPAIDQRLYDELSGTERFALLNIAARLRKVETKAGEHLLSPVFDVRVFRVFPDRIYLTASEALIASLDTLVDAKKFDRAPASLHRFNEGSVKQRGGQKGNVQLSYAKVPGNATRYNVDADIDLYRSPIRHLFGEVLVNHLTGKKTDQFKVWETLVAANVEPIGTFDLAMG
jgi:hypothetical protein